MNCHSNYLDLQVLSQTIFQALDALPWDPTITGPLEAAVSDLAERYAQLSESLANRCGVLESARAQSQGVEDSLDSITSWLSSAENSLKQVLT